MTQELLSKHIGNLSSTSNESPQSTLYSTFDSGTTSLSSLATPTSPPQSTPVNGDSSIYSDSYELTRATTCPITLSETVSTYKVCSGCYMF